MLLKLVKTFLVIGVKDSIPNVTIYIESVLPSNHKLGNYAPNDKVQKANIALQDIAKNNDCTFIDLYNLYVDDKNELSIEFTKDGVHLLPTSYNIWTEAIEKYIYE